MLRYAALAILLFAASCGTIMNGGAKKVPISTDPPNATAFYDGKEVGKTPCVIKVYKREPTITLTLDGYHTQLIEPGTRGNGWVFGNIILGGIPGFLLDAMAGSFSIVNDDPIYLHLAPGTDAAPATWKRPKPVMVDNSEDSKGWTKVETIGPAGS